MSSPHTRPSPLTVVLTVVAGTLVISIDLTIVAVALAQLSEETGASLPVIQWVTTGYVLGLATVIPAAAWTIGRFGARTVFLGAIVLFTLGSALVAASWDVPSLIGSRVLQGLAGGFVHPAALALVLTSAPPERRGRLMALMALPVLVGPVLGPVLGGWLLDTLSWRWMFLVNLPLGVLAVAVGRRNLPRTASGPRRRLDVRGLLLLPPATALLVLGASSAEQTLVSAGVLLPAAAGLVLAAAFVRHALRSTAPLLDLRLLGRRATGAGAAVLLLFGSGFGVVMVLVPLYWQVVRGESATAAGLLVAPAGLAAGLTVQVVGRLVDRLPPARVIATGITVAVLAYTALALQLSADVPAWRLVLTTVLGTVGAGCTILPTMTVATRSLEGPAIPAGTTIIGVLSQVSAAIGTAAFSVLLASALSARVPGVADGGVGTLNALPPGELAALAPAVADAFRAAFWLPVALMAAAGVVAATALRAPRTAPRPPRPATPLETSEPLP
ncbi:MULTISPECIES: DHA2 family efflux MFS transporter permease subunit [unclassified Blastococcus]